MHIRGVNLLRKDCVTEEGGPPCKAGEGGTRARTPLSVLSAVLTNWALTPERELSGTSLSVGVGRREENNAQRHQTLAINVFELAHLALNFARKLPTVTRILPGRAHLQGECADHRVSLCWASLSLILRTGGPGSSMNSVLCICQHGELGLGNLTSPGALQS